MKHAFTLKNSLKWSFSFVLCFLLLNLGGESAFLKAFSPLPQTCSTTVSSHECVIQFNDVDQPHSYLYIYDSSWNQVWGCENNCGTGTIEIDWLPSGNYHYGVYTYNNNWDEVCNFQGDLNLNCGGGGGGACSPTISITNSGSCPVVIYEWLTSGDVYEATLAVGDDWSTQTSVGSTWRVMNTDLDWDNLLYDEHIEITSCDDQDYTVHPNYCSNSSTCETNVTNSGCTVYFNDVDQPHSYLYIYDSSWNQVWGCEDNCDGNSIEIDWLPSGNYHYGVYTYDNNWDEVCNFQGDLNLDCGGGGNCSPTITITNAGSCPVVIYEWLTSGDVYEATLAVGDDWSTQTSNGATWRVMNTDLDWDNLLYDEHIEISGCDDLDYTVHPDYCGGGSSSCETNVTNSGCTVYFNDITQPHSYLYIYDSSWNQVWGCEDNCDGNSIEIDWLPSGNYHYGIYTYDNNWDEVCNFQGDLNLDCGGGGDCTPTITITNAGSCPVVIYEWLTSGDVYEATLAVGDDWSTQTSVGSTWRVMNTDFDWDNLLYDEHIEITSCDDQDYTVHPDYCISNSTCETNVTNSGCTVYFNDITQPHSYLYIYDSSWNQVWGCEDNCDGNSIEIDWLPSGNYHYGVYTYDNNWDEVCNFQGDLNLDCGGGGDCTPTITITNAGSCPVVIYEWLTSGDVYEATLAVGDDWSTQTSVGSTWRVMNTDFDWDNLLYDEHIEITSCDDQDYTVHPDYCISNSTCETNVTNSGCTVYFNDITQPHSYLYIYDSSWNQVWGCEDNCDGNSIEIDWLPSGNYHYGVYTYDNNWDEVCNFQGDLNLDCGGGGDCTPTITITNAGSCPVVIYEWLTSGDVYEATLAVGDDWSTQTSVGSTWRVMNTDFDWDNLLYDEHIEITSCDDLDYTVHPDYCISNSTCETYVTSSGCTVVFNNIDQPHSYLYIYDESWNEIWSCEDNCDGNSIEIDWLPSGIYNYGIYTYDNNWDEVCNFEGGLDLNCGVECPNDFVNAGDDITICPGEGPVNLMATSSATSECVACCSRTVSNTVPCNGGIEYVFYLTYDGGEVRYVSDNLSFESCSDGTARLTGIAFGNGFADQVDINIHFSGYTTTPPVDSPKEGLCGIDDASDWVYYTNTGGTFTSMNHGTYSVSRKGEAFQLGNGANITSAEFGASGWFDVAGGDGYFTGGDINIDLSAPLCPPSTPGVSYEWSNGETTSSISVNPGVTTTYTVTATDCNGCEDVDMVTVNVTNNVVADAGSNQTICEGGSVELCATGGTGYQWSNGDNSSCITVSPSSTTTYTVTVSDGECSDTDSATVNVSSSITADAGSNQTICEGGSVELCATGGTGYQWSNGDNSSCITVNPSSTTTYTVTVSDGECSDTDSATVNVSSSITADAGSNQTICEGGSVELCATGGTGYQWSNGDNSSCITVNPSSTTTYTVTVSDGECSDTDSATVNVSSSITADAGSNQTICEGGSVELCATGGTGYQWSNGDNSSCITVNPSSTTTYTVTVSDGECSDTDSATVNVSSSINADAGSNQTICEGGSVELCATGGTGYQWSNGDNSSCITVNPSSTTTYTVTVSDGECSDTDSVEVTVDSSITASAGPDETICSGEDVELCATGGDSYDWSTGATSACIMVSPTSDTDYSVTVSSNNCSDSAEVSVSVIDLTGSASMDGTVLSCTNSAVQLLGSSNIAGAMYNWTGPGVYTSDDQNPMVSVAGVYSLEVSYEGCTADGGSIEVLGDAAFESGISAPATVCAGEGAYFQVTPLVTGASYAWDFGAGASPSTSSSVNETVIWTTSGLMDVSLTVTLGSCTATYNYEINVTEGVFAVAGDDRTICEGESTILGGSPTGPAGASYVWTPNVFINDNQLANPSVNPPVDTEYTVEVTVGGCTSTESVMVTVGVDQCGIDLELFKSVDQSEVINGDQVVYTIEVLNKGPQDAILVTVKDILPAGVSFDSFTSSTGSYSQASGIWQVGNLPMGQSEFLYITADVVDITGPITNFAQVNSGLADDGVTTDSDSTVGNDTDNTPNEDDEDDATIYPGIPDLVDLELTKSVNVSEVAVGDLVTYTILLTNKGPQDATNVFVNDDLPAGLSFDSFTSTIGGYSQFSGIWSVGDLAVGDTLYLTINAYVEAIDGSITNFAQVQGASPDDTDSVPGNDSDNTPDEDDEDDAIIYEAEPMLAGLGDYVFLDNNANGIQDAGDTPLAGVTVYLYNSTDLNNPIGSYLTLSDGYYEFINLDPSITYVVEFVEPTGHNYTNQSGMASSGVANDSDADVTGFTDIIDLVAGEFDDSIDAGFIPESTVSGCLYLDANCNGVQDVGEEDCLPGIFYNLVNADTTVILDFVSTEDGIFIDDVPPGDYTLVFLNGPDGTGIVYGSDEVPITVLPGQSINDILVAYSPLPTGFISGSVWIDENEDCNYDGSEMLYQNAVITLLDADGNIVQEVQTGADGTYQFFGLCTGVFTVNISGYTDNLVLQNPVNGEYTISIPFPGMNTFTDIDFCLSSLDVDPPCIPSTVTECAVVGGTITVCPSFCLDGVSISNVFSELELGTLDILDDFCFTYSPAAGFSGIENVIVEACNLAGDCDVAYVNFSTVGACAPMNSIPVCMDDSYTFTGEFNFDPSENDTDPDTGDVLTISSNTDPDHGTVTFVNGSFTYTPMAGYNGQDMFDYQICDQSNECCYATVTLNVSSPAPPISNSCAANILFVGEDLTSSTDDIIIDQMEANGHTVTFVSSSTVTTADANGMDLVYISATSYAGALGSTFENSTLPVIVSESYVFDDMSMTDTGFSYYGSMGNNTSINIVDPSHPIVSGYPAGNITVSSTERYTWGMPTSDAAIIATLNGYSTRAAIYTYDTGDQMVGMIAPAPRVGFYIYNNAADGLNSDAWIMFESAIQWALGDCEGSTGVEPPVDSCGDEHYCTTPLEPIVICSDFCTLSDEFFITDVEVSTNCTLELVNDMCLELTSLPLFVGDIELVVEACDENGNCEAKNVTVTIADDCGMGTPHQFKTTNGAFSTDENLGEPMLVDFELRSNMDNQNHLIVVESSIEIPNCTLSLTNLNGQLISQQSVSLLEGITELEYSSDALLSGMYFLSIQTKNERLSTKLMKH